MEHNTNRILWTVLILTIGVALYITFRPEANDLLKQGVEKIQTVVDNVHDNTNTNLAQGTNSDWQKASVQSGWGVTYSCDPIYEIVDGETYTAQVDVRNATAPVMLELFAFDANGNRDGRLALNQSTDNDGKISITFTAHLPEGYAYLRPDLAFAPQLTSPGSYEFRRFKIEKGNIATPWRPNPED